MTKVSDIQWSPGMLLKMLCVYDGSQELSLLPDRPFRHSMTTPSAPFQVFALLHFHLLW